MHAENQLFYDVVPKAKKKTPYKAVRQLHRLRAPEDAA
jgi:hypothetical protein